jgi:hypothetical protein
MTGEIDTESTDEPVPLDGLAQIPPVSVENKLSIESSNVPTIMGPEVITLSVAK